MNHTDRNYLPRKVDAALQHWVERIPQHSKGWVKYVTSIDLNRAEDFMHDLIHVYKLNCVKQYLDKKLMMDLFKCSPPLFQFTIRRKAGIHPLKSLDNLTDDEQTCIQLAISIKLKQLHMLDQ